MGTELKEADEHAAVKVNTGPGFLPKAFNSMGQVETEWIPVMSQH